MPYTEPAEDIFMEDALNQRAVYWHPKAAGDEGEVTFEEPVEIVCHWQNVVEAYMDRRTGDEATSRSKIFVDRDLVELGVLWLPPAGGTNLEAGEALIALTSETVPFSNPGAFEIRRFDKVPDFDGEEFVRTAYL